MPNNGYFDTPFASGGDLNTIPDATLDRAATLDRIGGLQADRLRELQDTERTLRGQRAQATGELAELEQSTAQLRQRKTAVQRRIR